MRRRFLGLSPVSTNWIHTFQLPLALGQAIPWLWKANRPYQVESRNKTRGRDDWENLKSVSTPNTSAEQKPIMRTKGSANRNFMSARIISYFFLLNCVTSFEIGWATTSMRLNDSVAKKEKTPVHFLFQEASKHFQSIPTWKRKDWGFWTSKAPQWYVHEEHYILNYWVP